MNKYKPRLSAPSYSNLYYIHTSYGGKNQCIRVSGKYCIPNCVGYAWGRFYEITGKCPKLSKGNAENWYAYKDGYKRGKTPKLGAVICWRKGKAGVSLDGAGHVAIVEEIKSNGDIVISQSGYKSTRFWTQTIKKGYKLSGYVFQGFIYNGIDYAENSPSNNTNKNKYGKEIKMTLNELKKGSKGEQVKTVQRILYCMYKSPKGLSISGNFLTYTDKYVKKFQKANGLKVDGIVSEKTWEKLLK